MTLYIVATPIGNLSDISPRALDTLRAVSVILCEDTRVTHKLLSHYEIETKTLSYHHHSTIAKFDEIARLLEEGNDLALVSDAGTPGISDPGNILIEFLLERLPNISIIPIPGASAIISALSISGFPTDKYTFYGFIPHKKGKETLLKEIIAAPLTTAFYESPHRIVKTLEKLKELGLTKKVLVTRELTKKFEATYRGTIDEVIELVTHDVIKGEFTVVISR